MGLTWNVWLVVLTPAYENLLTAEMKRLGWDVAPLSGSTVDANPGTTNIGTVLAYRISEPKGLPISKIEQLISDIVFKNKIKYFGLVVLENVAHSVWRAGNIALPEKFSKPKEINKKLLN